MMAHLPRPAQTSGHVMLPGLRLIFATAILSISIVVFGLGAAALLRSAHDEFAGLPSWRALRDAGPMPTLALARLEPERAAPTISIPVEVPEVIALPAPPETAETVIDMPMQQAAALPAQINPIPDPPPAELAAIPAKPHEASTGSEPRAVLETSATPEQTAALSLPEAPPLPVVRTPPVQNVVPAIKRKRAVQRRRTPVIARAPQQQAALPSLMSVITTFAPSAPGE